MKYLLDTNICIYLINHRPPEVRAAFQRHPPDSVGVSVITQFELRFGAYKSQRPTQAVALIEQFLSPLAVLDFTQQDADVCARLRADLQRKGKPIGPYDLQIAAQALSRRLTLVSNNLAEFSRVPGLKTVNWLA